MNGSMIHRFTDLIPSKNNLELYVNTNLHPPHRETCEAGKSDFFSIGILVQGEVNLKVNLKEQLSLKKNNLLFFSPNTIKQIISASDDVQIHLIAFTSKFLMQTGITKSEMELMTFITTQHHETIALTDMEMARVQKIMEELENQNIVIGEHPFAEDIIKHEFRILLYEMAAIGQRHNLLGGFKTTRKQEIVTRFGDLLNEHFREERSVKYYAGQLSISPKHLTEVVHEVTGKSAGELIHEKLIQETKFLLRDPARTVLQIADSLNFPNQSFLGKFFKRYTGVSPSQYRSKLSQTGI